MAADPVTTTEASPVYCPVFHGVIELIGRRWTGAILKVLIDAPRSFGAIREEIPGLSDRLLTERLNELVAAGYVEKAQADRSSNYRLTAMGEDLRPVFGEIEAFANVWVKTIQAA